MAELKNPEKNRNKTPLLQAVPFNPFERRKTISPQKELPKPVTSNKKQNRWGTPPVNQQLEQRKAEVAKKKIEMKQKQDALRSGPKYFVSSASQNYLATCLTQGHLTREELPYIFELAERIAKLVNMNTPTKSEIELAAAFRNREHIAEVAAGKVVLIDPLKKQMIVRKDTTKPDGMMSKGMIMDLWKTLAQRLLEDFEANPKS